MTVGVVLCGGQSSRMGQNKAELIYQGSPLKQHMKSVLLAGGVDRVYFSGPEGIVDQQPGLGPLSGLSSCLNELLDEKSVLFVPVDMPLLTSDVIVALLKEYGDADVTRFEGQHFPLLLQNSAAIRAVLKKQLTDQQLALHQLFKRLTQQLIKPKEAPQCFVNVNTPEQWQQLNS